MKFNQIRSKEDLSNSVQKLGKMMKSEREKAKMRLGLTGKDK